MATVNVNLTCDLQHPVQVQYIGGNMFSQDNAGNTINVDVFNDGEPATLGGSISANVIRADGATVAVSGALSGNRAYVIFPQACYAVPGTITVIIKNTESSTVTTIAAFVANVYQSTTDTVVDPGTIIPSISSLIAQIEAAVDSIPVDYSGLLATIAADYSSSKTYPVVGMYAWQGGVLKRNIVPITTAETYTAAHWTNAILGDDVSALKSAICTDVNASALWLAKSISNGDGSYYDSTTRISTNTYIADNISMITPATGYKFAIVGWQDSTYMGIWKGTAFEKTFAGGWYTTGYNPLNIGNYKLKLVLAKTDDSTISTTDYDKISLYTVTDKTLTRIGVPADAKTVGDVSETVRGLQTTVSTLESTTERVAGIVDNCIDYKTPVNRWNGEYTADTFVNSSGEIQSSDSYYLTSLCPIKNSGYVCLTRQATSSTRVIMDSCPMSFWDADGEFITRISGTVKQIPSNAAYVRANVQNTYPDSSYSIMVEYCNSDGSGIAEKYSAFFNPGYEIINTDFQGIKICSFGDSIAASDDGVRDAYTWIEMVKNYFGAATAYNRGIGSSCVTSENAEGTARTGYAYVDASGDAGEIRAVYNTQRTFADYPTEINPCMETQERINTIPTDTDIIVIIAGTNDIGTTTVELFTAAYKALLNKMIARVPNAKIYPCTLPFQQTYDLGNATAQATYNSYRDAIKNVCAEYGLTCIDLRQNMGVNAQNYSSYMNDTTHFNTTAGRKKIAECVIAVLKGYAAVR